MMVHIYFVDLYHLCCFLTLSQFLPFNQMKLRSNIDNGCGKTSRTKDLFESLVRRCLVLARRDTRQRERVHNGAVIKLRLNFMSLRFL